MAETLGFYSLKPLPLNLGVTEIEYEFQADPIKAIKLTMPDYMALKEERDFWMKKYDQLRIRVWGKTGGVIWLIKHVIYRHHAAATVRKLNVQIIKSLKE